MSNFKLQFGNDIRRKSGPADLTYDGLKDTIVDSYLKPEADFDYRFKLAYQDSDEDWVTISNTEDLQLALAHHEGEVLKIVVLGAQKIDLKAQAFKKAFEAGFRLLNSGSAEASIPHFVTALRAKKDPTTAYNLACAFSLLGKADDALLWLRTAATLGYQNYVWAVRDPDLTHLRENAADEFVAIVREMRNQTLPPRFRQQLACGPCGPRGQAATSSPTSSAPPSYSTSTPSSCSKTSSPSSSPPPSRTASPGPAVDSTSRTERPAEQPTPTEDKANEADQTTNQATAKPAHSEALAQLAAMGFIDPEGNRLILEKNNGDLAQSLHELLFA